MRTRCSLCDSPAVSLYYLPRGCIAYPGLTVQALCWHHENRMQPLGGAELVLTLIVDYPVNACKQAFTG